MSKGLLISLGGTPAPLIVSITKHQPDCLLFFTSKETQASVPEILEQVKGKYKVQDAIVTPDANDFNKCFTTIYQKLPEKLELYGISPEELIVDYTGGTKNMSAALTLATAEFTHEFSYVAGTERTKAGTGIVVNGKEFVHVSTNPWDALSIPACRRISTLFNSARYASALEEVKHIQERVSAPLKRMYAALYDAIEGFYMWDSFQYKTASHLLNKGNSALIQFIEVSGETKLKNWTDKIKNLLPIIQELSHAMTGSEREFQSLFIKDLIVNARRRAEQEHKYDDAVARLYSCLERIAKVRLYHEHGKRNSSKLMPKDIPAPLRDNFITRYLDKESGCMKIGLQASYELLKALDDPVGRDFIERYKTVFAPLLKKRNISPLAHGTEPVTLENYKSMFTVICELFGINSGELFDFPQLNL